MKKSIALLLVCAMLLSSLAACGGNKATTTTQPSATQPTESKSEAPVLPQETTGKLSASENPLVKDTDTVVISLASDLESLNPITTSTIVSNEVQQNCYEGLLNYDLQGNVLPGLAESWEYDADTLTYTIKLRDDVVFHNGSKFTAEDAAFSMEIGKQTGRMSLSCNYIESTEVVDETTLKVTLTANYSPFLYFLAINLPIISKDYYTNGDMDGTMMGTGPYKFVSYTPGDKVVFEKFDGYYKETDGNVKNLIFKIVPDANTQFIALESGDLNLSRDFSMNNIQSILDNPELDIYTGESGNIYYMGINQSHAPLDNALVRQAINYAIDREFIIEACEEGYAEVANSIANKGMLGYTEDAKYYEYNPEKAKELLAQAGYPDGFTIDLPIITKEGKFKKAAEVVKEDLNAIGIKVELAVKDTAGFNDDFKKSNFALAVTSLNLSQDAHHATMSFTDTGYLNYFNINDAWINEQSSIAANEQDPEVRKAIYHDILCKVADDALYAPLYYPQKVWAITSGLKNSTYDRYVGVLAEYMSWE